MKKVRLILAASACLLAGAAVYANALVATTFWRASTTVTTPNPSTAVADCAVEIETTACPAIDGVICTIPAGAPGTYYIVSKKVDSPTCVLAKKASV